MTCPNCGHVYPISNGIPNMVCILRALLQLPPVLIFLRISRFSYWQSTRSGSVLALIKQHGSSSCGCIIKFYSTRDVFTLRHGTCKLESGLPVLKEPVFVQEMCCCVALLSRDPKQGFATQSRDTNPTLSRCTKVTYAAAQQSSISHWLLALFLIDYYAMSSRESV